MVIFALCIVLLLTLVAFAVDLGQARFSSRDNQQAADLASLAAGYYLAGNGTSPATTQPRAACEAAFASATTNLEGFQPTSGQITSTCSSFPEDDTACDLTTATIPVEITDGDYVVSVEWPISEGQISDDTFAGSGANDGDDNCERMRVSVHKTEQTTFARVIGVDSVSSNADAVVRGGPSLDKQGVAALLILEREGCSTLYRSGQGKVIVKSVTDPDTGEERPGVIQSDSAGSTTSFGNSLTCTTNENADGYAIYASCNGTNLPGIVAEDSVGGGQGIIATYAKKVGGRSASCWSETGPTGLSVQPIESRVTSRAPADERFNPPARQAISALHSAGYAASVTGGATTSGTVLSDNASCAPADGTVFGQSGTITFNCGNTGFRVANNRTVTISNATSVKFIGGVDVAGTLDVQSATDITISRWNGTNPSSNNTGRLTVTGIASFDKARTIYVGGTTSNCTQDNNCSSVKVSGNASALRINTGSLSAATCVTGPGGGGPSTGVGANWTQLATFGGAFDISGSITMCQTMAYVGRSASSYSQISRISGGLNCSSPSPCPVLTTDNSRDRLLIDGGNASVIWTAPNQTTGDPDATNPFEGLALWTEGTGTNQIKGTGTLVTTGVFFLPNALFQFNGQASASNPFNAQFFSRTLNFSGQGDLNLAPNPRDSVRTAIPGDYGLIR